MPQWLSILITVAAVPALLGVMFWYFEVYTPRKHMREAIQETNAAMGQRPPRPSPPHPLPGGNVNPSPAYARPPAPPAPPRVPRPDAWPAPPCEHGIRYFGDMQKLKIEPGDVFVLALDRHVSAEGRSKLKEYWKGAMGDAKLLVLEPGMRLGVVHSASAPCPVELRGERAKETTCK